MHKRRILTAVAVLVGIAAAAYGARMLFPSPATVRRALFNELHPVTLKNCTLSRYGGANDGGFLMCENLLDQVDIAYSYGVGDDWACDVSRTAGLAVHRYNCNTPKGAGCKGGRFVFHDECVDTIASHVAKNRDTKRTAVMQIDADGVEGDALRAVPDETLDRITQIAIELHGTDERRFVQVIRRLKEHFHLVNLHFDNHACTPDAAPF